MTSLSQIWLCGLSEVIRADHVTSLFVADGTGRGRASESNGEGVLWAHVVGRAEPARVEGFTGITAAEVLDAVTGTIARALTGDDPLCQ